MSSIVTAVPFGLINWCLMPRWFPDLSIPPMTGTPHCDYESRGTVESDFGTICCEGSIVNARFDMFLRGPNVDIDLADLVCCREQGTQAFDQPRSTVVGPRTQCMSGTPIPLLSLAATNTQNAQNYSITYTSVTVEGHAMQNIVASVAPYCVWFNTARASAMKNITVSGAQVTTTNNASSATCTAGITSAVAPCSRTASATQGGASTGETQIPTESATASSGSTATWRNLYLLGVFSIGGIMIPGRIT
jgi:hypothetical protein